MTTAAEHEPLVRETRQNLGVSRKVFSRLTGFSERSIASWESGRPPSPQSEQRLLEMRRLQEALARVMDSEEIPDWLSTPNRAFDGLKPLEVVERGEIDRIWRMVFLLESGTPS